MLIRARYLGNGFSSVSVACSFVAILKIVFTERKSLGSSASSSRGGGSFRFCWRPELRAAVDDLRGVGEYFRARPARSVRCIRTPTWRVEKGGETRKAAHVVV